MTDQWFIESGTLLGAHRNGKFIPHDDDFDMGVFFDDEDTVQRQLEDICERLGGSLPPPYKCRLITSYCDKVEVYDPTTDLRDDFGEKNQDPNPYILPGERYNGSDYHHVTVDLQAYVMRGPETTEPLYRATAPWRENVNDVFPCREIVLEEETFKCPNNTLSFLEAVYGSLSPDAVYDPITKKYVLPEAVKSREISKHASMDSSTIHPIDMVPTLR